MSDTLETHLDWSAYESYGEDDAYATLPATGGAFGKAAAVCIGNRQCQRLETGVMCPSYRITEEVEHSTWYRARTLKAALNGEYGPDPFAGPELEAAMDLCVACKGCKRECPNGVDMALLRAEFLAQRWSLLKAIPWRERMFAYLPRYASLLGYVRTAVKLRDRIPLLAKLGERWFGIAARRSLPPVAPSSFLSSAPTVVSQAEGTSEVVLFVDTFSNHFNPETADAALGLLNAAGYTVHMVRSPSGERPLCCGRTFLSQGMIAEARTEARRLVDALKPYADRGLPIIGLEPSCLLMLRDEFYSFGLGAAVEKIAKSALLLEEFLAKEKDAKRLQLAFVELPVSKALIHGHCHQKAFGAMKAMRKVLALVPGLQAEFVESSCCGMAGAFGFEAEHYDSSMRMAELNLLPKVRETDQHTLVVANGVSCRHQIKDGAGRDSVHLAVVLRAALAPMGQPPAKAG